MKKANKKLTLTAILAASAITLSGCASQGNVTVETENVKESEVKDAKSESRSEVTVKESPSIDASTKKETERRNGDDDDEELIDFDTEENINVCVYGPPPEER